MPESLESKTLEEELAHYRDASNAQERSSARKKIELLTDGGNSDAIFAYAAICLGECDPKGVQLLHSLEKEQYLPALYELGNIYYFGFGEIHDVAKGLFYWRNAAFLGHLYASINMLKLDAQNKRGLAKLSILPRIWACGLKIVFLAVKNPRDRRIAGTAPNWNRRGY